MYHNEGLCVATADVGLVGSGPTHDQAKPSVPLITWWLTTPYEPQVLDYT